MNRPVIFLDFDGVLNTEQYQAELAIEGKSLKDQWGPLFDPRAVVNLKRIIDTIDAEIVISSSWRHMFRLGSLRMMWEARELPGEVRDMLPPGATNISRGEEIEFWLKQNECSHYVIIDDLNDFLPAQHDRYIEINPIVGITEGDADKAIEILKKSIVDSRIIALEQLRNSKTVKHWREFFRGIRNDAMEKMHKRHAFLSEIVKVHTSLEDFAREKSEFFEMMGIEFGKGKKCISLYFQLDYNEYEKYFVVPTNDGRLAVSHVIWWQNEVCANEILNIFTGETYDDDEVILTTY